MGIKKLGFSEFEKDVDQKIEKSISQLVEKIDEGKDFFKEKFSDLERKLEKLENNQESLKETIRIDRESTKDDIHELSDDVHKRIWIATGIVIAVMIAIFGFLRNDFKEDILRLKYDVKEIDSKITEAKYHDHTTNIDRNDNSVPTQTNDLTKPLLKKTK